MSTPASAGEQLFAAANAPLEVLPGGSWASVWSSGMPSTDLRAQYGTQVCSGDAAENTAQSMRLHKAFHSINQDWLLKQNHQVAEAIPTSHTYMLRTPVEKFQALARGTFSVSAIAVLQWVANTSNGSEMVLSKPVALVLSPLITTAQTSNNVSYNLETVGLAYGVPTLPLGQLWSSHHIYSLISPMFRNMQTMDTNKLFNALTSDWNSMYQFDHGLRACYSVRVLAELGELTADELAKDPLWVGPGGSPLMELPPAGAAMLDLATGSSASAAGAWTVSKLLFIPEGANLPVGFGVLIGDTFS